MPELPPALLVLEDGTRWPGQAFGAPVATAGEIVFNTSLTGYQEILSDPSYHGQLVTLTMPQIGNTGVNGDDLESDRHPGRRADLPRPQPPGQQLARRGRPAVAGSATRACPGSRASTPARLVLHIRRQGAMRGALGSGDEARYETLLEQARTLPEMTGRNLAREVTCREPYTWTEAAGWWRPGGHDRPRALGRFRVVAMDFGIKRNILRLLAARGCRADGRAGLDARPPRSWPAGPTASS